MKSIIAELSINNQVKIRYSETARDSKGVQYQDKKADIDLTHISRHCYKIEQINKVLVHACKEYNHQNISYMCNDGNNAVRMCVSSLPEKAVSIFKVPVSYPACDLSCIVEYYDEDRGEIVKTNYRLLASDKQRHLDIIKKSQQTKKKHDSWGKPQSPKSFSSNAKQRILEAGAAVENATKLGDQYELTLTIPGSGIDVYCAVANWSGYIVNRLTQIIRRWEKKNVPVYWFFVWEHQKRGALHMHWCIAIPGQPMLADYLCRQIRAKWYELLEEISEKIGIDLFKKRGFLGTWRYNPEVWQSSINHVRKSVAAYFSKYCSKNVETQRILDNRRRKYANKTSTVANRNDKQGTLSLYPSRYWGSSGRVKRLCRKYRVSVRIPVSNATEGNYISQVISEWVHATGNIKSKVSRVFEVADAKTSYVYARGWEKRLWFDAEGLGCVKIVFDVLYEVLRYKKDKVSVIATIASCVGGVNYANWVANLF